MLLRHLDQASLLLVNVGGGARLFGLFQIVGGLGAHLFALLQLVRFHLGRLAIEHVYRLESGLDHSDRSIEETIQMRGHLARLIRQLIAILTDGDKELVKTKLKLLKYPILN